MSKKLIPTNNILAPFKFWCQATLPLVYDDSLSYYELLCKVVNQLNEVIKVVNNDQLAITELQNLYIELKNYVDNYFNNLDIQTEINNKLDQMASDGTLAEIISMFLQSNNLLCFNTINDLKQADYLINGSFVKTLGYNSISEGTGNIYKIRNKLTNDVIDEINIISLLNNQLVGELIIKKTPFLNENRRFICIGDSYNIINTNDPTETVQPWGYYLQNYMQLSNSQFYNFGKSGAGWAKTNNQFITLLQDNEANITNKNTITDILVLGGVNDNAMTNSEIFNAIKEFSNYCLQNYPNAIITIGLLSWARSESLRKRLMQMLQYYNNTSYFKNIRVVPRLFQIIHCYNLQIEDGHPNNVGNQNIAYFMFNYLKNGVMDNSQISDTNLYANDNTLGLTNNQLIGTQYHTINKYNVNILININDITSFSTPTELRSGNNYKLGAFNDIFAKCNNLPLTYGCGWAYDGSKYYSFNYVLIANNGDLYFRILSYANDGSLIFTPTSMGFGKIPPISIPLEFC